MLDAELLDELTTNRGELKARTVSFSEDRKGQVGYWLVLFNEFLSCMIFLRIYVVRSIINILYFVFFRFIQRMFRKNEMTD